jgi:hypothetical protein
VASPESAPLGTTIASHAAIVLFFLAQLFSPMRRGAAEQWAHGLRLGADFPCHFAQRFFIASEMRLRAAAVRPRRFLPAVGTGVFVLGGRPRRGGDDEVSPSSAEMAWSIRLRSTLRSETRAWMSIESFRITR